MAKKLNVNNYDLHQIDLENLEKCVEPWGLAVLLELEPYTFYSDMLFAEMLEYYVQKEMYDYCIVIRDEINKRK